MRGVDGHYGFAEISLNIPLRLKLEGEDLNGDQLNLLKIMPVGTNL